MNRFQLEQEIEDLKLRVIKLEQLLVPEVSTDVLSDDATDIDISSAIIDARR